MKKTYVTTMPDHIGAFLKASECLASLDVNITRVSYNKAVDIHTLFIEAEGDEDKLGLADSKLREFGYLQEEQNSSSVVLLEFMLEDVPGSVTSILRLISEYKFNISFISSHENGTDFQFFKMGLLVENHEHVLKFIEKASEICKVRVIEYDKSDKMLDNVNFYNSFVNELSSRVKLDSDAKHELLINVNLAMQTLDERGLSPYKTFGSIGAFSKMLSDCKGGRFVPRISRYSIASDTEIIVIEPPCGSNTIIIRSMGEVIFVDSGYAIFEEEMVALFKSILPDYEKLYKRIVVTHADVDHCGLLGLFDEVYGSVRTAECFRLEFMGEDGFREQNELHKPYIRMCKILTQYKAINPENMKGLWARSKNSTRLLEKVGTLRVGELDFCVYEGKGGHLAGEIVLVDSKNRLAFTGDIYVNTHGLTKEQSRYNQYAPILMTSVDTDPVLCKKEREELMGILARSSGCDNASEWMIFGAHGSVRKMNI